MRNIKFRAWNGHEMIMPRDKSYYQHYMSFCGCIIQKSSEGMECFGGGDRWRVVVDLSLMQFTGLTDINGVEIYEGDIVYVPGAGNCEVKISCYYGVVYIDSDGYDFPHADCVSEQDYPTIIGNIYQNPELLK